MKKPCPCTALLFIAEDTVEPRHALSYQITLLLFCKIIFENKCLGMHFLFSGAFKKLKCFKKIFKQQHISGLNYRDINVSVDAASFSHSFPITMLHIFQHC